MNYDEWISLPEGERDKRFKDSIKEMNKLSARIDFHLFNMRESYKKLKDKVEEYKLWERIIKKS